jgi:nanoRNase/pAp phosphatase (c-di-AMP/oligoRNAs hydrolase)
MTSRLVLGCGSVGRIVLTEVRSWSGPVYAVVEDESRADELRKAGVDARVGDPSDPANYPTDVAIDVVLVAGDDDETNSRATAAASDRYPAAYVVAVGGEGSVSPADRIVDPTSVLTDHLLDLSVGTESERLVGLLDTLRELRGPLAVVTHDNPDPDAIAAALALVAVAETVGVDADPCYFGDISHQENRALVNLLDIDLRNLEEAEQIDEYDGVALVDHSRPGVNDSLDPETDVDVVIDHHPPRGPVNAAFVDLRSDAGSTSTLLADYLDRFEIDPDETVATALLYGIHIDTRDFTREVSRSDFEAAAFLLPSVDRDVLERVESPSVSPEVIETVSGAIRNRVVRGDALTSCVGYIRNRDALAQAADRLLDMDGIRITVVYGIRDDTVYVSGRARGTDVDLGETLRSAFGSIGSAGGHADMAGGQLSLGIITEQLGAEDTEGEVPPTEAESGEPEPDESDEAETEDGSGRTERREAVVDLVDSVLREQFFETLEAAPSRLRTEHVEGGVFDDYGHEETG